MQIPDMTLGDSSLKRTVKPTEVALPYRYIPQTPKAKALTHVDSST
jgi:hypothetical protein